MVRRSNDSRSRRAPTHITSVLLFFPSSSSLLSLASLSALCSFSFSIYLLIFALGRNARDSFASRVRAGPFYHLFDTKKKKLDTREKAQDYSASICLWKEFHLSTINAHVRPTGNVPNPLARRHSDEEDT